MRSTLPTFNEVWQQQFNQHISLTLAGLPAQSKLILGCSGGMDSMLLLHLFASIIPHRLFVISIDHQLQQHSDVWSAQVAKICADYQVECKIIAVTVGEGNTEAAARQARYAAFESYLSDGDILILGHHQQDQAETVLLRLLQGSGVGGLSAMSMHEKRHFAKGEYSIWRPMLELSRQQITYWINSLNRDYIKDPMNHDQHYDRVWCRETLWPVLEQRFAKMQEGITRSAKLLQDADQILKEVLEQDIQYCILQDSRLNLQLFQGLSEPRQRQVLSYWMQGDQQYRPSFAMVERLKKEVIYAKEDAVSELHCGDYVFVRFDGDIYRFSLLDWQRRQQIPLPEVINLNNKTDFSVALGQVKLVQVAPTEWGLSAQLLTEDLTLLPRQGGERLHVIGRVGTRPLKKLLQDAKIAPWDRHHTQIFMYHNTLLGVFTAQGFWLADQQFCEQGGWLPKFSD